MTKPLIADYACSQSCCGRLACVLLLLIIAPASTLCEVKVYPSKSDDLTRYKTYQWLPVRVFSKSSGLLEDDPDVAPLIRQAVTRELARKGYTEVARDGELLLLVMGMGTSSPQLEGFLLVYNWDVFWGYDPIAAPVSRVNREGTLAVGFVNARTNKGVWLGYATEALGRPETLGKSIDKAASRLMKKLPARK